MRSFLVSVLLLPNVAVGEPSEGSRNYANLRVGAQVSDASSNRTTICGEVEPVAKWSIEACGAGGGWFHHDPIADMFHVQLKWFMVNRRLIGGSVFRMAAGVGFTEIEQGNDEAGLQFRKPKMGARSIASGSGSLSASWHRPLGAGLEFIANGSLVVGYFEHSRLLATPMNKVQPSLSLQVGIGF